MNLILLTSKYPYGKQEVFVSNELEYTYQYFDKITIYNFWDGPDRTVNQFLPPNAEVKCVPGLFNNKMGMLGALFSPKTPGEFLFDVRKLRYRGGKQTVRGIGQYLLARKLLTKLLLEEDTENTIFYSYWLSYHAYALAEAKKQRPEMFCVSRTHNVDCFLDRQTSFFRRETVGGMDYVFPCSDRGTREITERILPFLEEHRPTVTTSYLGVACDGRRNPDRTEETLQVVSISNFYPVKRLDLIIGALAQIKDIPIHWTHFGDGVGMAAVQAEAEEKLKGNVTFCFKGRVPNREIHEYFAANHVDVFVNASDFEGIPVSIMEAMSYGIIAVARDAGGNREAICDEGDCGILLPNEIGPEALAEAIVRVASMTPEETQARRDRCAEHIDRTFNQAKAYRAFAEQLLRLRREWPGK